MGPAVRRAAWLGAAIPVAGLQVWLPGGSLVDIPAVPGVSAPAGLRVGLSGPFVDTVTTST